jgi:hypothetical protein
VCYTGNHFVRLTHVLTTARYSALLLYHCCAPCTTATLLDLLHFGGIHGAELEDALVHKLDWPGIKLAVANAELPAWAGRGVIPDVST